MKRILFLIACLLFITHSANLLAGTFTGFKTSPDFITADHAKDIAQGIRPSAGSFTDTVRALIIREKLYIDSLQFKPVKQGSGTTIVRDTTTGVVGSGCADDCYWKLGGNRNLYNKSSFIGTVDKADLIFKTNDTTRAIYYSNGTYAHFNDSSLASTFKDIFNSSFLELSYSNPYASYFSVAPKTIAAGIVDVANQNNFGWLCSKSGNDLINYLQVGKDSISYQCGSWDFSGSGGSAFTELSVFNGVQGHDESSFTLFYSFDRHRPYTALKLNDTTGTPHFLYYENNEVLPDSNVWALGTAARPFKKTVTSKLQLTEGAGQNKILVSDPQGNAHWQTRYTTIDTTLNGDLQGIIIPGTENNPGLYSINFYLYTINTDLNAGTASLNIIWHDGVSLRNVNSVPLQLSSSDVVNNTVSGNLTATTVYSNGSGVKIATYPMSPGAARYRVVITAQKIN